MAFNGAEFYELAGSIYQRCAENQASLRTSISRSYYGAFLCARNMAGIADTSEDVHKRTYEYYVTKGQLALANSLDALRRQRNQADYYCRMQFSRRDVYMRLSDADKVLRALGITASAAASFAVTPR
jgi:hypothetical protein